MSPFTPSGAPGFRAVQSLGSYSVPADARSPFAPGLPLNTTPEWHLARRAAQAPSFRLAADIRRLGVEGWLDQQLAPGSIPDPAWEAMHTAHYRWLDLGYQQIAAEVSDRPFLGGPALGQSLVHRPVLTSRVLFDSLCDVWGDHIFVPWRSKSAGYVIPFDREVIRRHALGRYADLLLGAVTDPAVLYYLDNVTNVASKPNENLGRELLELYTIGGGQYSEDDVKVSSRILTGLTADPKAGTFVFDGGNHASGPVSLLGFTHANPPVGGRSTQAPDVVRAYVEHLSHHPLTARRLALKLAIRFVSDSPSESLVQTLAKVYLDNDTRIAPVVRALFTHQEFWGSVGQKWARPREVIGRARRSGADASYTPPAPMQVNAWDMGAVPSWYENAGELPRDAAFVDGYGDTYESWSGTSVLLATCNATAAVAWQWDKRSGDPAWRAVFGLQPGMGAWDVARTISVGLTGYTWRDSDLAPVASLMASGLARPALQSDRVTDNDLQWGLPEAVHLVLSSPYSFLR